MRTAGFSNPSSMPVPQWGILALIFVETSIFTRQIRELISDASYQGLQRQLMAVPDAGAVIRGGGGCRKVRWSSPVGGKRGGIRVIYYWMNKEDRILMLLAYSKSRQDSLTPDQVRALGTLVRRELGRFSHG